jgi:hypothetical protein
MGKLGIIAGGGELPILIAKHCKETKQPPTESRWLFSYSVFSFCSILLKFLF